MHRVLTVIAVVALLALGSSVIGSLVLRSSISKEQRQISALDHGLAADKQAISALRGQINAKKIQHRVTATPTPSTATPSTAPPVAAADDTAMAAASRSDARGARCPLELFPARGARPILLCAPVSRSGSLPSPPPRQSWRSPSGRIR